MYKFTIGALTGALAYYWFGSIFSEQFTTQLAEWDTEELVGLVGCAVFSGLFVLAWRRGDDE